MKVFQIFCFKGWPHDKAAVLLAAIVLQLLVAPIKAPTPKLLLQTLCTSLYRILMIHPTHLQHNLEFFPLPPSLLYDRVPVNCSLYVIKWYKLLLKDHTQTCNWSSTPSKHLFESNWSSISLPPTIATPLTLHSATDTPHRPLTYSMSDVRRPSPSSTRWKLS